jgi:hypothetical protein
MKTHFDKTQELIIDIVKDGDMELISSRIKTLEEKIENREDALDNWETVIGDDSFKTFAILEMHMWQVELDMLLGKKFRFINK